MISQAQPIYIKQLEADYNDLHSSLSNIGKLNKIISNEELDVIHSKFVDNLYSLLDILKIHIK